MGVAFMEGVSTVRGLDIVLTENDQFKLIQRTQTTVSLLNSRFLSCFTDCSKKIRTDEKILDCEFSAGQAIPSTSAVKTAQPIALLARTSFVPEPSTTHYASKWEWRSVHAILQFRRVDMSR